MPRLIVLNGPPGCGKSTLARMFVADHPLALNLDIDRVRDLIGGWQANAHEAGLLARGIALAAARAHLSAGHDVVIPQFLGRVDFLQQVEQLAMDCGVRFHEAVLLDSKENVLRRFTVRTEAAADQAHLDAHDQLDRHGGLDELAAMYDRLMSVIESRRTATVIRSYDGQADRTYQEFLSSLA